MIRHFVVVALVGIGCAHGGNPPPPLAAPPPTPPAQATPVDDDADDLAKLVRLRERPAASAPAAGLATGGGTTAVKDALVAVGAGQAQPADLAVPLSIGPALWALLLKLDPELGEAGSKSITPLPHKTGKQQTLEVRTFTYVTELAALLRSPGFRKVGRAFGQAKVRLATDGERETFYVLVPFEIAGRPVTIAEREADRLVVFLDDKGRLAWLDVLSGYQ
jgi:hypothetical protein